jgi:hypothetical protein
MPFDPITAILSVGNSLIDRLIPDKTAAAAAKAQLVQMQIQGDLEAMKGQLAADTAEAANQSVFVAGWRPFVGWVCGLAFAYALILQPFILLSITAFHVQIDRSQIPTLDLSTMMPILIGMLGLGAMRSYDKTQGTGSGH